MDPRKRLVRKEILRVLRIADHYGATSAVIAESLMAGGEVVTVPEIEQHLQYLAGEGKGYVRVEELEVEGLGRRVHATLLPKGIDLLEGNIPVDPGVSK